MKTLCLTILSLTLVQTAWAWDGSGTSTDPYLIKNLADWRELADAVSGGNSCSGQYFEMQADIDAEGVSVGTNQRPFGGTFDGGGHTLTYNRGERSAAGETYVDDFCAPFVRLDGATIRRLRVAGAIYSNHMHAAGIASLIDGEAATTIDNCHVSSLLRAGSSLSADASFAGLVGNVNPTCTADPVISNCTFTGSIQGSATRSSGLVGYTNRPVVFTECYFMAEETPSSSECATLVRTAPGVACTFTECYYTKVMGTPQGKCLFTKVLVPEGCTVEILDKPSKHFQGVDYYTSGITVNLTVPEGTPFDHWASQGTPGCYVSDPWTAGGTHTLTDIRSQPSLSIATSMPEPYQSNRERLGITYRYLSDRDYLLFMSDSLRQARGYQFDSDGECFVYDAEGTKTYITVVWNCNPQSEVFQNFFRDGWFQDKDYEGSIICNDLVSDAWEHTHLFAIAPRAFLNVGELKRLVFMSDIDPTFRDNATMPLDLVIQEQAFKDSGIEELVMMYLNRKTKQWEVLDPTTGVTIAADAFEGTNGRLAVDPGAYQRFLSDKRWSDFHNHIGIYAAKVEDMSVNGAVYSYWRDNQGEPLKNDDAGHKTMMERIQYWNSDYAQFNAASLLTNSSKNVWYTQVIGADDSYLRSADGVMRIYNDPGSQYNYKTLAIQSLGQSKELRAIEFYQTNGLSDNSYTDVKMVIQNGALKGCDNLRELRMFYYIEDGEDRWTALTPKDVIPGDNIFGLKVYTDEQIVNGEDDNPDDPTIPSDFRILVATDYYYDFIRDPNWISYSAFIEPVDYSPSPLEDFTKEGLTYSYMANPGGILQTSQVVSQDVSWWTAPRIAIEVAMYAASLGLWSATPSQEELTAAARAFSGAKTELEKASSSAMRVVDNFNQANYALQNFTKVPVTGFSTPEKSILSREYARAGLKNLNGIYVDELAEMGMNTQSLGYKMLQSSTKFVQKVKEAVGGQMVDRLKIVVTDEIANSLADDQLRVISKLLQKELKALMASSNLILAQRNATFEAAQEAMMQLRERNNFLTDRYAAFSSASRVLGVMAANATTAGVITAAAWGGSNSYSPELLQKGMRENIRSNIHAVSVVGGSYIITTPTKNINYHTYIKDVDKETTDAVIYAGFDDDNNSNTSNRTMTFARKAFRDHKKLRSVSFHAMQGQTSNAAMQMLFTIPDSAFAGCDNLEVFSTLLRDNEGGTRALGPENFILSGDSIFAGRDSTKFHIVIDPLRKQDFLDNESWAPLQRYFVYDEAKPSTAYTVYGAQYAYAYEGNSIKKENKVGGHLIEHTIINGANNDWLSRHNGTVTLYNDIGQWNNYQLDAVTPWAFQGNELLRSVKFTDIHYSFTENPVAGDVYTGLQFALQDSCFAKCPNLETVDLIYAINDGTNHIEPMTTDMVKVGRGVLDNSPNALFKIMPRQLEWFTADSAWASYKDRFLPVVFLSADEGVMDALDDLEYYVDDNQYYHYYDYIDLSLIPRKDDGSYNYAWLDGKFTKQKDNILTFADFKHFEGIGLSYVGREWFRGCSKLSNILLPSTLKYIEEYAFASCSALKEIELPDGVMSISTGAFADCAALRRVIVRSATPAHLGEQVFQKNDGLQIFVPAGSLDDYLTAWAEYKDYIVSDADYNNNKVVTLERPGTLADKLGLTVEWEFSNLHAGSEMRYLQGNYSKYDSLTISGPLNDLDLAVIRYLAGCDSYTRGGKLTDGRLRYLNLYGANIVKDKDCDAYYLNRSTLKNSFLMAVTKDNELPEALFFKCTALQTVILPKSIATVRPQVFAGCSSLKRVAITGNAKEYDVAFWDGSTLLTHPLQELVLLYTPDTQAASTLPWGQTIENVYTTKAQIGNLLNDPKLIEVAHALKTPFEDDAVWNRLTANGEFFLSEILEKEDVGTIFSEEGLAQNELNAFDEFKDFLNVKQLHGTFAYSSGLKRVTLPVAVEVIGDDVFTNCQNLETITMLSDSVPELAPDAFKDLLTDFRIIVPRSQVKNYRTKWQQYADHIYPAETNGGYSGNSLTVVTVEQPNTLAKALGLEAAYGTSLSNLGSKMLTGLRGDYNRITRLKVNGPLGASDFDLLRHLAGYCPWAWTRNYAGQLEYIDLYDAWIADDDDYTIRGYARRWDGTTTGVAVPLEANTLPMHAFLRAYNLKTLILPRSCKEVESRALQECEGLETLVLGDDMEEFNWNALDDDAMLTRMYILAKKKVEISTEFAVWRWLCNNYNPTFDAFYVRPSLYREYLYDDAYTGSSWQRTNNVSKGIFDNDETFLAFASHAAATEDDLMNVTNVEGWFDIHKGVKDLTPLQFTLIDSLSKATLAPLTQLERIKLPFMLEGMEDGLFENAPRLRYVDFLNCDSTSIVAKLHNGGLERLGIDTRQTLVYVPYTYGPSDGTNIVSSLHPSPFTTHPSPFTLHAKTYRMIDSLDYCVPYAFEADKVENTRSLPTSSVPYTVCVPYRLKVPGYAKAYALSSRKGNSLVFTEVTDELQPMHPYLLKVIGNKRLRKTSATLDTEIGQTIPASGVNTDAYQEDVLGYTLRGSLVTIGNQEAAELGAYILQSDGDWHPVTSLHPSPLTTHEEEPRILPFRAYLLPSTHYDGARISMTLEDTDAIDTVETIDRDGTHRYYDLNGHELQERPDKGIYIYKGKKHMNK